MSVEPMGMKYGGPPPVMDRDSLFYRVLDKWAARVGQDYTAQHIDVYKQMRRYLEWRILGQ